MNVDYLIRAIVQQTTILIAQLATSAGVRAPLAHIANETFLSLAHELSNQGLPQKVIADMFGLALRSYQQKVQRLTESESERGKTLWEAVYEYLREQGSAGRDKVLQRFRRDNQASVRGILNDLVESGLVYRSGVGADARYLVRADEDRGKGRNGEQESAVALVWLNVYERGPINCEALAGSLGMKEEMVKKSLSALIGDGRVRVENVDGEERFRADSCLLPLGEPAGWEAALFDHYQALIAAMCTKLRNGETNALPGDEVGGSTFAFDIWPGHPQEARVRGLLAEHRKRLAALWDEVEAVNCRYPKPEDEDTAQRVTFYFGQFPKGPAPVEPE